MQITRAAIYRPIATIMIALGLIFLGLLSFRELPVQRLPDITFPALGYYARSERADLSPDQTNDELTRPLEKLVASMPRLKETNSTTGNGWMWGYARFENGTDMRFREIELQDKVAEWLTGRRDITVQVQAWSTEREGNRLIDMILSVPDDGEALVAAVTDHIERKLKSIDGIATVDIAGRLVPNLVLETDRDQLLARDLDENRIVQAINARAGEPRWLGDLSEGPHEHAVRLDARIARLDELLDLRVDPQGVYRLGDLTAERDREDRTENIFRINGKRAVSIDVTKDADRNTIAMARAVRERVDELRTELPPGFDLRIMDDEAEELESLISNLAKLAAGGSLLAMLVLLVFVRNARIALIVVVTIPAAILVTFNALWAAGLSINILSLLGLAAGVGMVVDNSIVVVENVFRFARHGADHREAAWQGSREVVRAILIATLTNLVVFVPMLFIGDELVLIVREMALALVFPMAASLLIAVTLIPALTALVISRRSAVAGEAALDRRSWLDRPWNPYHRRDRKSRRLLMEFVLFWAKAAIRHPVRLFFVILIAILASASAAGIKVAVQRFDENERTRRVTVYGKTPAGSTLDDADAMFRETETKVAELIAEGDVFEHFTSRFDKDGGRIELRVADAYRDLRPIDFTMAYRQRLTTGDAQTGFRMEPFPQATMMNPQVASMQTSVTGGETIEVVGENIGAMTSVARQIQAALEADPNVTSTGFEVTQGEPEVHFIPDLELFQVMEADASGLQSFFQSRDPRGVETNLLLDRGGVDRRVVLKLNDPEEPTEQQVRQTLTELRRTKVATAGGGVVPLEMLGRFSVVHATPPIQKRNRQRNLPVKFELKSMLNRPGMEVQRREALASIQSAINEMRLPSGVSVQLAGTVEQTRSTTLTWKKLLRLAVLSLFLIMAFFFESLTTPLIILLTLPLAALGAIWGLIVFNGHLDEIAMVSTIILAGLVVNNGILLIEFAQIMERERRWRRTRAILTAVRHRVRPIMMTTLTTVLGLLPILLSEQAGREARSLVAVLVGGLLAAAVLTLVVIPSFYNVFTTLGDRVNAVRGRLLSRWVKSPAGEIAPDTAATPVAAAPRLPAVPEQLLIEIENVSKIYPQFHRGKLLNWIPPRHHTYGGRPPHGNRALYQVSLRMEPGMFGLLGPNGAGKSTLMRILTGLIPPTYGVVRIGGVDLRGQRTAIRQWISYLPQNFGVYGTLSLDQYLEFFAPFYGLDDRNARRRAIGEAIEWVSLSHVRHKPLKSFSGGMRQRAGIAQLLLSPCPIMIVDEPTAGLDPVERVRFRLLLAELARTRIVILSTHIVDDITSSCRRVAVLSRGSVVFEGDVDQIREGAQGMIWDLEQPEAQPPAMPEKAILFKRHLGDRILYHYCGVQPIPGSTPVDASFEDAYVALLLRHGANATTVQAPASDDTFDSTDGTLAPAPS